MGPDKPGHTYGHFYELLGIKSSLIDFANTPDAAVFHNVFESHLYKQLCGALKRVYVTVDDDERTPCTGIKWAAGSDSINQLKCRNFFGAELATLCPACRTRNSIGLCDKCGAPYIKGELKGVDVNSDKVSA